MVDKILLIGGGGYCKQVIEILKKCNDYEEIGIVEKDGAVDGDVLGVKIVGHDSDLKELYNSGWKNALVTLGSVGSTNGRRKIFEKLKQIGFVIPTVISKDAVIETSVKLQEGTIVSQGVIIGAGANVGVCSIINKGVIISHDCKVGNFVHVSPGCVLLGNVTIGNDSHIGAAASIREGIVVGEKTIIGMGSVVVKDIPDNKIAYGNPCLIRGDRL